VGRQKKKASAKFETRRKGEKSPLAAREKREVETLSGNEGKKRRGKDKEYPYSPKDWLIIG